MDILDILLDEKNNDPIVLTDDQGTLYRFQQIAVIPYNNKIYCILKPIDPMKDIEENEAIVFYVDEKDDSPSLKIETDELTALKIFEGYYDLLEKRLNKEEAV